MNAFRNLVGPVALAVAIGAVGGVVFSWLHMPLPWMLGSMAACLLAVLASLPVAMPHKVLPPFTVVLGVMLGSNFTPGILDGILGWAVPVVGLVFLMAAGGALGAIYLHRVVGFDRRTAFFAGMPGGIVEMTMLGGQYGADVRQVALIHSARILLVVSLVPILVSTLGSEAFASGSAAAYHSIADLPWTAGAMMVVIGLVGVALGHLARIRAKYLIGPMLVSAAAHLTGVSRSTPPSELVNIAQLMIGISIGCRFVGVGPATILRTIFFSAGSTLMLLAVTLAFAYAVMAVSDFGLSQLVLAYAPGGLTEMTLMAISMKLEVAFVAFHHVLRVALVTITASFLLRATVGRKSGA